MHTEMIKICNAITNFTLFWYNTRRRQWHPTPVLLPGKSHGWKSLVGCSPRGREESDRLHFHFHFSLSCFGEGNGNPLQCSCLENSRDGGDLWAAVYGVAQSRTTEVAAAAAYNINTLGQFFQSLLNFDIFVSYFHYILVTH